MKLEDIFIKPNELSCEPWHLGNFISNEIQEKAVVLIFCSDERGGGGDAQQKDFSRVREELYALSALDFEVSVCDLGDLISGKNQEDTHYILQEVITECFQKKAIPIVIGGSNDLAFSIYMSLYHWQEKVNYTQINSFISLDNQGDRINEKNFLSKIIGSKNSNIENYYHLGYQKHMNEIASVQLMNAIDFEVLRLADMMNTTDLAEPYLRRADMVTLNCDAVESFVESFSKNPQVNGLNRREICAYMKEIGLGQNLKSVGIFNFNTKTKNQLNHQLLAQMIWYLLEGIDIQKTHPKERAYETFLVLVGNEEYPFRRDVFSGQWYFGKDENIEKCIPCSEKDYEDAKRGNLNKRFLR